MAAPPQSKRGKYLYAIVPASGQRTFDFAGIDGASLYTVASGRVAAVVSDVLNGGIRPKRRHLAAQQAVFTALMAATDALLPLACGIIADSPQAVQRLLARHQEALLKQLLRVAGMVEMGLRVSWDVPNIFAYFLQTHPELRAARDRLPGFGRTPSQEGKLELGRLFDRLRQEDRETYAGKMTEVLSDYCQELKRHQCRRKNEVVNLACLVRRQAQDRFEEGVYAAGKLFDHNFSFACHGPGAPHSFAALDLQLESQAPEGGEGIPG